MTQQFVSDLTDFANFANNSSIIYPWAKPVGEIIESAQEIFNICGDNPETDSLYDAIDLVCGINPILV